MIKSTQMTDGYLKSFAAWTKELKGREPVWLSGMRAAAITRFSELGFPTSRHEAWRFTNVAPLAAIPFRPPSPRDPNGLRSEQFSCATFGDPTASLLVFVNGQFREEISTVWRHPNGVVLGNVQSLLRRDEDRARRYLAVDVSSVDNPFRALNTAFMTDGAFVYIPPDVLVEEPIHILFVSTPVGEPLRCHPRNVIIAEDGGRATIVESYIGFGNHDYFMNAVTEIACGASAGIDHYHLQRENERAFHITDTAIRQDADSNLSTTSVSLGGALVRNDVRVTLDGEEIDCTLNGLYMTHGVQHVDNHTYVDHARPNCTSHELYKGILDGESHGVFNGRILVRQDAQRTDARQTNRNLLLSDDATTNSMPQLEIYADDVKCTHGATTGKLDDAQLFYLQSRGIDRASARALLTYAFASEIIGRIKIEPVRAWLDAELAARTGQN